MAKGLVYILTNPSLDNWVKIGKTNRNDINERLRELNSPSNIPLSYRCYATYEVDNPEEVEAKIHSLIDRIDISLHAIETLSNGKIRKREFFKISPETAYGILKDIASLRKDEDKLKLYAPTPSEIVEEQIANTRTKRSNCSFKMLNIDIGEEISFLYDDNIKAIVVDNKNTIKYKENTYSVTSLAIEILTNKEYGYNWNENLHVNGWKYFTKDNIILSNLRDEIEKNIE